LSCKIHMFENLQTLALVWNVCRTGIWSVCIWRTMWRTLAVGLLWTSAVGLSLFCQERAVVRHGRQTGNGSIVAVLVCASQICECV
jgi:hypothetical protein